MATTNSDQDKGRAEVDAIQYVVLAENHRQKMALAETKAMHSKIVEENEALLKERAVTERENYEVTEYLRTELLAKTEDLSKADARIKQIQEDHETQTKQMEERMEARLSKILMDATDQEEKLANRISLLEQELITVEDFRIRQKEIEEETIVLRESNRKLEEQINNQKYGLERDFLEQSSRLKRDFAHQLQEERKSSEDNIHLRMHGIVKQIVDQNRHLSHELKLHIEQTDELQQEVTLLENDRNRIHQELELKIDLERKFALRGSQQSQHLKEANAKISRLECTIQDLLQDMTQQKHEIEARARANQAETMAEIEGLKHTIKLKSKELKNIRRLAHAVLLQRSAVESFLLSSLELVRKELSDEQPDRGKVVLQHCEPEHPHDILSLSWADREKVLQYLFAKIFNEAGHNRLLDSQGHNHPEAQVQGDLSTSGPVPPT